MQIKETASETCWVESLDGGWLFLLPTCECTGSLIAVGDSATELLEHSRLVNPQIESLSAAGGRFAAYPRILDPLCAPGWLACGSAVMSFDPICGEGAGQAVREAILASALLEHWLNGHLLEGLLNHYSSRLLAGFLRHLVTCRRFYVSAHSSEWWQAELTAIESGIEWTRRRLSELPKSQYRLVDFALEPVP
ncbi:MAG TPA: hypothetical protein VHZ55_18015 [Bryobacteraceae bacterium]|nr:hypothetical protein [Bryobacteraceae bacterium]